ncbi:MAG: copper amine oxidase N-terminal domain-containing protein [Candidatus Ornithomonoglobus sp.]
MKKIIIAVLLTGALCSANAAAADDISIVLNGDKMSFEQTPFIEDGTTLVPMRAIFEALGAEVEWNGEDRSISSEKGNVGIRLQIGSKQMYRNDGGAATEGDIKELEKAPVIVDDFTYVPLRAVAEAFDAQVLWDGEARTVSIVTAPEHSAEPAEAPESTETAEPEETAVPSETPAEEAAEDKASVYAKMYEGTGYELVRNIPELTNDFEEGPGNFKESQHCAVGKDHNGNGVLFVQKETRNQEVHTEAKAVLYVPNGYVKEELIDISFDLYCPKSNGGSDFYALGKGESTIAKFAVSDKGKKLTLFKTLDEFDISRVQEGADASTYFNNDTEGNEEELVVENGAHVNMLINPAGSKITITITNNTNDAEPIVIKEFVSAPVNSIIGGRADPRVTLYGIKLTADYYSDAKPMFIDNLVTNIVKTAE